MSFTSIVSELLAAALREFLLRRPIHAELERSQSGQWRARLSLPPSGEAQRAPEVHYFNQPAPQFYPNLPMGWGGYPGLTYAPPPQYQNNQQDPPHGGPQRSADPAPPLEPFVLPANWRS